MPPGDALHSALLEIATGLVGVYVLVAVAAVLRLSRPGLRVAWPVTIGLILRVLAAVGVSLSSFGSGLRGGDELGFIANAHALAALPLSRSAWVSSLTNRLYEFSFAAQFKLFDSPEMALRIFDCLVATGGILLLVTAVYDLAGPRAALISAWLLAFEPSTVFFASVLHKEPYMFLAGGLVAFGGARLWRRGTLASLLPMVLGCLVAIATRPYAGYFLIAAAAATVLHASLRIGSRSATRGIALLALVVMLATITAPIVVYASSKQQLAALQYSQNANATNTQANLSLEKVDYSTRSAIITHLPRRILDVLTRPYPWQVGDVSQQLGVLGTLVALGAIVLAVRYARRSGRGLMERAGPLVYTGGFLLVAYSLSAGNAGTSFRYRSNVISFVICVGVILHEHVAVTRRAALDRRLRRSVGVDRPGAVTA